MSFFRFQTLVFTLLLLLCCLPTALWAADRSDMVVPVDGEPFAGRFAAIDAQWKVTFETNDQTRVLAAEDLVYWGAYRDVYRGTQILMVDDSLLCAEVVQIDQDSLVCESLLWGRTEIPIARIRGVVFDEPVDSLLRDRLFHRVQTAKNTSDQLILGDGQVVSGGLLGMRDRRGRGGVQETVLQFSAEGRELNISLDRVVAAVFNPALAELPKKAARRMLMGFDDGSLLKVTSIGQSESTVQLGLACGVRLEVDSVAVTESLRFLFSSSDRVRYISDLPEVKYKQIPFLDVSWPLARDRSTTGGRLRSAGRVYLKGLGMHSASTVAFSLNEPYRRFQAEVAIDDRSGLLGSVVFRVFLYDRSGKRTRAFESPVVRGGDAPIGVRVDLSGARAVALVVDFSERGDVLDHAHWLNARLIK